jgi:hypothetical protein
VFAVSKVGLKHTEFWQLSWYEVSLYIEQFGYQAELRKEREELEWARFRIQWADFRNANRSKKGKVVKPTDLIQLSFDDRVPMYHEIDIEAIKRRFGSKIKKRGK